MTAENPASEPTPSYSFPKEERLRHKKLITRLFGQGSSFLVYPYRIVHLLAPEVPLQPVQVLISIPKKHFKRAVDRNRLKRQTKEIYRLNKAILANLPEPMCNILGIQYVAKEKLDFKILAKKLTLALQRLSE
jgi:ribonuclease P protein component